MSYSQGQCCHHGHETANCLPSAALPSLTYDSKPRCDRPGRQRLLAGIPHDASVADFQGRVASACGVEPPLQSFKAGFPPRLLPLADPQVPISEWGVHNGESLILDARATPTPSQPVVPQAVPSEAIDISSMTEDEQLARAIAASMGEDLAPPPAKRRAPSASTSQAASTADKSTAAFAALPDGRFARAAFHCCICFNPPPPTPRAAKLLEWPRKRAVCLLHDGVVPEDVYLHAGVWCGGW